MNRLLDPHNSLGPLRWKIRFNLAIVVFVSALFAASAFYLPAVSQFVWAASILVVPDLHRKFPVETQPRVAWKDDLGMRVKYIGGGIALALVAFGCVAWFKEPRPTGPDLPPQTSHWPFALAAILVCYCVAFLEVRRISWYYAPVERSSSHRSVGAAA